MRRWLLHILAGLSLLLCLAAAGLWVRSYWRQDSLVYLSAGLGKLEVAASDSGHIIYCRQSSSAPLELDTPDSFAWQVDAPQGINPGALSAGTASKTEGIAWYHLGFGFEKHGGDNGSIWALCFPHWLAAVAFGILPAIWIRRLRVNHQARFRIAHGLCPHCGYDLRASTERCPECGAACKAADPAGESPVAGD